ncbi:MAG: alpha/beta hydrolase-fold protein [Pseudomonadota bacterium]
MSIVLLIAASAAFATDLDRAARHHIIVDSDTLNEPRDVFIGLPNSYEHLPEARYPVLFVLDAHSEFEHANALVRYLAEGASLIPEFIVVGVVPIGRGDELRPTDPTNGETNVREVQFRQFLTDELSPRIDAQFRTHPYRVVFGHSLAGLFVLNTLRESPGSYNAYVASSPALWWQEGDFVPKFAESFGNLDNSGKTLVVATEGGQRSGTVATLELLSLLEDLDPADLTVFHNAFDKEEHGTVAPVSLYWSIRKVFDGWSPDINVYRKGLPALLEHYETLSKRYGWNVEIPLDSLSSLVFDFARRGEPGDAEKVREIVEYVVVKRDSNADEFVEMVAALKLRGLIEAADLVREALCAVSSDIDSCAAL